ncbi:hypothetical protein Tco_0861365 [Tanacetum coccineum]|uniref:Uncharacterized protein n=1 Tax=Tanacetum coccineum TaxID=301880 RepID=A0ABQ5BKL9_9ASTR
MVTEALFASSQSTTTALSIENGSLFEGESECENLLHHTSGVSEPVRKLYPIYAVNFVYQPWRAIYPYQPVLDRKDFWASENPNTSNVNVVGNSSLQNNVIMQRCYVEETLKKCKRATCINACYTQNATTLQQSNNPSAPPRQKNLPSASSTSKFRKGKLLPYCDEDDDAQQDIFLKKKVVDPVSKLAKKMSLEAHKKREKEEGSGPVGGVTIRDPVSETTSKLHEVVGKGKAVVTKEQVAHSLIYSVTEEKNYDQFYLVRHDQTPHDSTTGPSSQPEDDTSEKVIHESSSMSDSERTKSETEAAAPKGDKDHGCSRYVLQRPGSGQDLEKLHVSLAGPNPEHMDDEFLAIAYLKVHENLKLITDERVIDDKPESHSGSMSSMKNLDDTYNFGVSIYYDKQPKMFRRNLMLVRSLIPTIHDPSHQTELRQTPLSDCSIHRMSHLLRRHLGQLLQINTELHQINTSLPEITPSSPLQLKRRKIRARDILERHTADLMRIISVLPGPEDEGAMDKDVEDKVNKEKVDPITALPGTDQPHSKDADQNLDPESEHSEQSQMTFQCKLKIADANSQCDQCQGKRISKVFIQMILKICSYSIFNGNASTSAQDIQDSLLTASTVDRNLGYQEWFVETCSSGLKVSNKDQPLNVHMDAADNYLQRSLYDLMAVTRVMVKWTTWLDKKTFICSSTIRAMEIGSGQRLTEEMQRLPSLQSTERLQSDGSSMSRKALLEKIKRDNGLQDILKIGDGDGNCSIQISVNNPNAQDRPTLVLKF